MTTTTWTVTGMTCDHCANAITEDVVELDGVETVVVDRPAGTMTVTTTTEVADTLISETVAEAGNYAATRVS